LVRRFYSYKQIDPFDFNFIGALSTKAEGKLLKTRFDEIFAATKYIKALDTLKKVRLEKNQLAKQMSIERKHLEVYKTRAEQLKLDLSSNQGKLEELKAKKESIIEKLKPIEKQLELFFKESARIFEMKSQIDKIESEKQLLEKQIKELLVATKDCAFIGSDEELREHVRTFAATTQKMRKEQQEATQKSIEQLSTQLKQLNTKKSNLRVEITKLEIKQANYLSKQELFRENVEELCQMSWCKQELDEEMLNKAMTTASSSGSNNESLLLLLDKLSEKISSVGQQHASMLESRKQYESLMQGKIEAEREKKSKLDEKIANKRETIEKNKKTLANIDQELSSISDEGPKRELSKLEAKLEKEVEQESTSMPNVNEIKEELKQLDAQRIALKANETKMDEQLSRMHENAKFQTSIELLKNDKQLKEEQIRKTKLRIKEDLDGFFEFANENASEERTASKIADAELKPIFELEYKRMLDEMSDLQQKHKEIDKKSYSIETKRKALYDDMRHKETKMRDLECKLLDSNELISSQSEIEKFDAILDKLEQQQKTYLDEKGFLNGVEKTYKRFLSQLDNSQHGAHENAACPVCMRSFKDERELDETVRELRKYSNKLPSKIVDLDSKLKSLDGKLEQLRGLKSIKDSYMSLKDTELGSIREQLDSLEKDAPAKLKSELKQVEEKLKRYEKQKASCDYLHAELVIIEKLVSECSDIEKRIQTNMKSMNSSSMGGENNIQKINEQKKSIQQELTTLNKKFESKQDELSSTYNRVEKINKLKESLNNTRLKLNELDAKMQKKNILVTKQTELREESTRLQQEIETLNEEMNATIKNVTSLIQNKKEKTDSYDDSQQQLNNQLKVLKDLQKLLCELKRDIDEYERNDQTTLTNAHSEQKQLEIDEKKTQHELEKMKKCLDDIKTELARHEIKQRELTDNMRLREKRAEHDVVNQQYKQKMDELQLSSAELDLSNRAGEQKKLEKKRDEFHRELAETRTSINNLEGRLQTLKEELDLENYKSANEKYSNCLAELRVLEITIADIEKYYKALDRAVLNYHLIKMNEINKCIKALWNQVYRGSDIDYIEIRSEEELSADEELSKTRRTYNYRVVLVKGDTSLDMRGRCSTGQKVLASIIIRLALAETFCLNSGILALDEPTTNLDRESKLYFI
jgi:DNA repair protein RAD50